LKGKKQDISIGKLFRKKLEGTAISPDPSLSSKLMRKLAWKEFLHFSPLRFNMYYLGGILFISLTAVLIFTSGLGKKEPLIFLDKTVDLRSDSAIINIDQNISQRPEKTDIKTISKSKQLLPADSKVLSRADSTRKATSRADISVKHTSVNDSFVNEKLFGASPRDKQRLQSLKPGKVLFESSASEGCAPVRLYFINYSDSYDSCKWTFGDGGFSNKKNPEWIFDVAGKYKVVLDVYAAGGLKESTFRIITVYPKPVAQFEIRPEKAVLPDDDIQFINYSTNAVKFNWDFGDGNSSELFEPNHRYMKSGKYNVRLVVYSDNGCSDSLYVKNAFSGSENFINFPNAFIPNPQGPVGGYYSSKSDESAQIFHPVYNGISDYQLKIFSKIGIQIFESRDINIGWDGYFNGQLCPPGVYIWKVRGNYLNGESFTKLGDLTLLGTGLD
jgi:PKD repeat protein